MQNKPSITYSQVGDNYETKDPINQLSQSEALQTARNLKKNNFEEIEETRGESAYVWKQDNIFMASVIECLGTKNLIADEMRKITGKTYYDIIAHDTVATFMNDLATVGAKPLTTNAFWSIEDNSFLEDKERMTDFIKGWSEACNLAGASWGGGETSTSRGIIIPGTINLAGSAVGIITSEKRLLLSSKLKSGDRILLLKSNGINANGISLARAVSKKLPKGYATEISDGTMYGEALLTKSNIYAKLIQNLLDAGINLHYITNITGHGLRKIMRAPSDFIYTIEKVYPVLKLFSFIQKQANLSDEEMYGTYNMGQDYALFLPKGDIAKAQEIIRTNGFDSLDSGYIKEGGRQVVIKPKNIIFTAETLSIR